MERENQNDIFTNLQLLTSKLRNNDDWLAEYVRLEFMLLACSGFGLDLEKCAATGQAHDLLYVSPRTGRAVSREAGEPYHDRLFALPSFINSSCNASIKDIINGIKLCGHFLHERIFSPRNMPIPEARTRFVLALANE